MSNLSINYKITDLISEEDKLKEDYLKSTADQIIAQLVYDKEDIRKAYNYYNGILNKEQYRAIEEHYGMTNPTTMEFIPLVRRHIDTLVGEFLRNAFNPRVTCKDSNTLRAIERDKQQAVLQSIFAKVKMYNDQYAKYHFSGKDGAPPVDPLANRAMEDIASEAEESYVSQYEMAAQDVLNYLIQSRSVDAEMKLKQLLTDLLITGTCCYRVYVDEIGQEPQLEVTNVLDVFYYKNDSVTYIKNCNRIAYRRYMTRQDILYKWGHLLSEGDKELVAGTSLINTTASPKIIETGGRGNGGIIDGYGVFIERSSHNHFLYNDIMEVFEVEWIADNEVSVPKKDIELPVTLGKGEEYFNEFGDKKPTDKVNRYRQDRYRVIRIGGSVYPLMGRDDTVVRSMDEPYKASLSFNGLTLSEKNSKPYSLILQTAALQDKYNILHYFRDALIANSGTKGTYLDVAQIPKFLGHSAIERIEKAIKYKKGGTFLVNSADESNAGAPNTLFTGYDETVSGQGLAAIQSAILQIEETASAITGVYRQALGNIEQKDAVSNVRVGINQSAVITKQYFHLIDTVSKDVFTDLLNLSKITFKKGMKASYILGHRQKIFTIDPNYFGMSDYDIHISTSGDELKESEYIRGMAMEMAKASNMDFETVMDMITSNSLTDLKTTYDAASRRKRKENDIIKQLQQQLDQTTKDNKKLQTEVERLVKKEDDFKARELDIREREVLGKLENEKLETARKEKFDEQKIQEIQRRTDVEEIEAIVSGKNKEVKNID